MRGLVLYKCGKTELREVEKPVCGEKDIIIKVESADICGGDVHFYNGSLDLGSYPIIMGHEFAGTIAEMGPKADSYWKIGDRVVSENTASVCGRCPSCEKGNFVNCASRRTLGCDENGAFTFGGLQKLYFSFTRFNSDESSTVVRTGSKCLYGGCSRGEASSRRKCSSVWSWRTRIV